MPQETELAYRYAEPSSVTTSARAVALTLSTSADGIASAHEHPVYYDGFVNHAEQAATALLAVARVARSRFYTPPGMLAAVLRAADPVVTIGEDRVRFESFSVCCGVYARFDLLAGSLNADRIEPGTTNVDFNAGMRDALSGIRGLDPLHLQVGHDVHLRTLSRAVTERKVPLPRRWVKGFAEVSVALSRMQPTFVLTASQARRFIRSLPTIGRASAPVPIAVAAADGARLTTTPADGGARLAGPQRLSQFEPLLRFASRVLVYADPAHTGGSAWEFEFSDARLLIALSPDLSRGFSGEGGLLQELASVEARSDASSVAAALPLGKTVTVTQLAGTTSLTPGRVTAALAVLGALGQVGYDSADTAYFQRTLPFDLAALEAVNPRLTDARALHEQHAVQPDDGDPTRFHVRTDDGDERIVRVIGADMTCTCPWYAQHHGTRGPCKHVLAVQLARQSLPHGSSPPSL